MNLIDTSLKGAFIIEYSPYFDHRGTFSRIYCSEEIQKATGMNTSLNQINRSQTIQSGVVRGLHYQQSPYCETKIITCFRGKVFDVMVDIRNGSPTFLQWFGIELSEDDHQAVFIPEGFAHGFQTLEPNSELIYLHTAPYSPEYEGGIRYNDPAIAIDWPLTIAGHSDKDSRYPLVTDSFSGILL